jgi:hypothetical protein
MGPKRAASADDAPVAPSSKRAISHCQLVASRLRDVLPDMFGYVAASRSDLFSATLVCRDWAVAASAVLWRSVPTYAFDYVASDRRRLYTNRVRQLAECEDPSRRRATFMMAQQQHHTHHPSTGASDSPSPYMLSFPFLQELTLRRHCRRWKAIEAASPRSYLDRFIMSLLKGVVSRAPPARCRRTRATNSSRATARTAAQLTSML